MSAPRRHAEPRSGESGMTLVELLVAAMVTSVMLSAAFAAMMVMTGSLHRSEIQTRNIDQLRQGVAVVARDLRAASDPVIGTPAFARADPDGATFYTRVAATPQLMHVELTLEDGVLREVRTPVEFADYGSIELRTDEARTRILARDVVEGTTLLTYRDVDGVALTGLDEAAVRRDIRLIDLRLRVATDGGVRSRPTELATTVRLANLLGGAP